MLSKNYLLILVTAVAPILWGTTYLTTIWFLPEGRPLLSATMRALPAGLILLLIARKLPKGSWWWRSWVLGMLNIGAFFVFLFISAYRLPSGVAAMVGGVQPLIVAIIANSVLHERLTTRKIVAASAGVFGVSLIVLQSESRLDVWGLLAAMAGILCTSWGMVLAKKWGQPASPLATTSWQLIWAGLTLAVLLLVFEGIPAQPLTGVNWLGFAYLSLIGTALGYVCWFSGLSKIPASVIAFLGLLNPVIAVLLGSVLAKQSMSLWQWLGVAVVLISVAAGANSARKPARKPQRDRIAV